jgi:hypothetical protein
MIVENNSQLILIFLDINVIYCKNQILIMRLCLIKANDKKNKSKFSNVKEDGINKIKYIYIYIDI